LRTSNSGSNSSGGGSSSSSVLSVQKPDSGSTNGVSLGCADSLLATATQEGVHFYDIRGGGKLLGEYVNSHSDEVLCVRFHPTKPTLLMTGGADGLACVFDVAVNGEDEALVTVCNAESDVVNVKVLDGKDLLCCQTSVETLALFTISDGQCVGNFANLRQTVAQTCGYAADYVVETYFDAVKNQVHALVGTFSGDLLDVIVNGNGTVVPCCRMSSGHYRPVRCAAWGIGSVSGVDGVGGVGGVGGLNQSVVVTGGEDSRVCMWQIGGDATTMTSGLGGKGGSGGSGGSRRIKRVKKRNEANPY
jgi:WD40 repeat protein